MSGRGGGQIAHGVGLPGAWRDVKQHSALQVRCVCEEFFAVLPDAEHLGGDTFKGSVGQDHVLFCHGNAVMKGDSRGRGGIFAEREGSDMATEDAVLA